MFKDDNVYKVYFPLEPVCMHLSNASKEKLIMDVPIEADSSNEKILFMDSRKEQLFDEMNHMSYLSGLWFTFTVERFNYLHVTSTIFALLINLVILFTYEREVYNTQSHIIKVPISFAPIDPDLLIFIIGIL